MYHKAESRCLSPIRSSCRPTLIDNYAVHSPKRISRSPIRQKYDIRSSRTPNKSKTPIKYIKISQPIISYKPLNQQTNYSVTSPYQNGKLFTNLVNKLTQKYTYKQEYKENLQKQQISKSSFSSLLQNIKAVESIQYVDYQPTINNNQLKLNSNSKNIFDFNNGKIQKSITMSIKPPFQNTLNYSFKQIHSQKSIEQFEDVAALLKKIQGNNNSKEQYVYVNASLDKNTKESLNMDPFL